ncbi:MAG: BrnA antitoxin family protein [Bauldia sp.]|nr:BrnA antitoxin family protein [Bauldia sp.]
MSDTPRRRTGRDPREAAEAAFRAVKNPAPAEERRNVVPGVKESVTLRIDSDVLAFFQKDGPGWQERIVEALRLAAGTAGGGRSIPVEDLNASNDE